MSMYSSKSSKTSGSISGNAPLQPTSSSESGYSSAGDNLGVACGQLWKCFDDPEEIFRFVPFRSISDLCSWLEKAQEYICELDEAFISVRTCREKASDDDESYKMLWKDLTQEEFNHNDEFENLKRLYGITPVDATCILLYSHEGRSKKMYQIVNYRLWNLVVISKDGEVSAEKNPKAEALEDLKLMRRFIGTLCLAVRKLSFTPNVSFVKHFWRSGYSCPSSCRSRFIIPGFFSTTESDACPSSMKGDLDANHPLCVLPYASCAARLPECLCSVKSEFEVLFEPGTLVKRVGPSNELFAVAPFSEQINLFLPFRINYDPNRTAIMPAAVEIACWHFLHAKDWEEVSKIMDEISKDEDKQSSEDDEPSISGTPEGEEEVWTEDDRNVFKQHLERIIRDYRWIVPKEYQEKMDKFHFKERRS